MKSYTDLTQSKKLAEILPLDSADMVLLHEEPYETSDSKFDGIHQVLCVPFSKYDESWRQKYKNIAYFPCWSLAALLNLLPSEITYFETTYEIQIRKYALTKNVDIHQIAYGNIKIDVDGQCSFKDMVNTGEKENLIDVAFDMILILKERNLL